MKHIAIILGTRPEAIKLLPLYMELERRGEFKVTLISTGQHRELVEDVLHTFSCKLDINLDVMEANQALTPLIAKILLRLEDALPKNLDLIIVQGDTASALAGSMIAFFRRIPCAHVEAGLRSHDIFAPYPEEFNRRLVSLTAKWHFAPTDVAARNLVAEGVDRGIYVVGNTSIDAALMIARQQMDAANDLLRSVPELNEPERKIILVTAHRRENFGAGMDGIVSAIQELANTHPQFVFVWPVHPNPNVEASVRRRLSSVSNIRLLAPLGYRDLLYVMQRSFITLTDSGGIQEEAPAFSSPVLVLRGKTERPEALDAGCNVLVGTEACSIVNAFNGLVNDEARYKRMAEAENPYGDGRTSQRIAEILSAEI